MKTTLAITVLFTFVLYATCIQVNFFDCPLYTNKRQNFRNPEEQALMELLKNMHSPGLKIPTPVPSASFLRAVNDRV